MKETNSLRYLIIGTGGTGGALGAHLAHAGKDVAFIARGAHKDAIKENGLRLIGPDEDFTVYPVSVYSMEDDCIQSPDVMIVCVKGYSIRSIIPFIERTAGKDTVVIPILNIFGTGAEIQKHLPDITVTDGCIYVASEIRSPGVIWMNGTILRVVFGLRKDQKHLEPELRPLLEKIRDDMNESGISGILSDNIESDAMRKFSYVSPQGACGLYYNVSTGAIQEPGEIRDCFAGLVREISALADAMGIGFSGDIVSENLKILDALRPDMTTSLQRDIAAGKDSEIDGLIYEVVRKAEKYGVRVPMYQRISEKLKQSL